MKHAVGLPQHLSLQIASLLAEAAGVDARSLDASRLQWVVEARCRHLKRANPALYAEHLQSSPQELEELIDAIVVPETRFFRDPAVFQHLEHWLPQMATDFPGPLRVLSAPCSTGQEAYSLAALLHHADIPYTRFTVDAFDISSAALAAANRGQYAEDALRGVALELQRACGTLHYKHWKMHDALRHRIRFQRRNLAQPDALTAEGPYHLILCRNLFIYLRPEARRALAQSLASALLPGGRLVLGSADRVEELTKFFSPLKPAAGFAFMHRQELAHAPLARSAAPAKPAHAPRPHKYTIKPPVYAAEPALTTAAGLYQRALEHKQHGELRKSERRCRQVLYLDPKFLPALELLKSLWSHHPDVRLRRALEARILRHRAELSIAGTWKETA